MVMMMMVKIAHKIHGGWHVAMKVDYGAVVLTCDRLSGLVGDLSCENVNKNWLWRWWRWRWLLMVLRMMRRYALQVAGLVAFELTVVVGGRRLIGVRGRRLRLHRRLNRLMGQGRRLLLLLNGTMGLRRAVLLLDHVRRLHLVVEGGRRDLAGRRLLLLLLLVGELLVRVGLVAGVAVVLVGVFVGVEERGGGGRVKKVLVKVGAVRVLHVLGL